jgi:hypothetical protein
MAMMEDNMRDNLDRALMVVRAFGYNQTPSETESSHHSEAPFHQRLLDSVIPFMMFFVKLFASVAGLLMLSIVTYWFIYSAMIMRGLEVQSHPIFFDYSAGASSSPFGRVDLQSTSHAPWVYACDNSDSDSVPKLSFCVQDDTTQQSMQSDDVSVGNMNTNSKQSRESRANLEQQISSSVLKQGQRYFVDVVLVLPESDVNKKLGMFMLTVNLRSQDGSLLARSKQSTLFPFESRLVGITRKTMILFPLLSGVIEETKTLSLLCFDDYMDMDMNKALSYADVILEVPHLASYPATTQTIQIVSAEFHYGKMMSPLQRFFRRWFYFCAFIGVFFLFISFCLLALNLASRRGWLLNRHAYFQAFDFLGSETDSTYNFEAGSQQNSWTGPDVEILDSADDDDVWEPLDSSGINANKSNVVPDDESIVPENEKNKSDTIPAAAAFPLGPLSQNPTVQSHKTLSSAEGGNVNDNSLNENKTDNSAQEEEKCLADMVMKGISKWEVFTGEFRCVILLWLYNYNN